MKWVKASERLPEKNKDVYIRFLDKKSGIKDSGHWDGETFWSHHHDYLNSFEGEELQMVEWLDESPRPKASNDEDELWDELISNMQHGWTNEELKSKFHITKKP